MRSRQVLAQAALIAEISNSRVTLSLTRTPPASSAAFQVMPQSLRLMTTEPSKPTRSLPNGSAAAALEGEVDGDGLGDALDGQVAGDADDVVADRGDRGGDEGDLGVVRDVEEVVAAQVAVALLVAGVDAVDLDGDLGAWSGRGRRRRRAAVASNSLNEPRTLVTIAWRATKPMRECGGSTV